MPLIALSAPILTRPVLQRRLRFGALPDAPAQLPEASRPAASKKGLQKLPPRVVKALRVLVRQLDEPSDAPSVVSEINTALAILEKHFTPQEQQGQPPRGSTFTEGPVVTIGELSGRGHTL